MFWPPRVARPCLLSYKKTDMSCAVQDGGLIRGGGSSAEGAASRGTHKQCSAMFNARGTRCQVGAVTPCNCMWVVLRGLLMHLEMQRMAPGLGVKAGLITQCSCIA